MADLDIGAEAIGRDYSFAANTVVEQSNPCNGTGTISSVEIWASTPLSDCEVATFLVVSGNNLSTRDSENIGAVAAGSKQTFAGLDMDAVTGDYLGIYFSAGTLEVDIAGVAVWVLAGDQIPCADATFTVTANRIISLYGTGTGELPSVVVTPGTLALTITTYAPTVLTPRLVTPSTLALSLTTYAPTVGITEHVTVTPSTLALILTEYAPGVLTPRLVTPSILALLLTSYAPVLNLTVTPSTLTLTLTTYSPRLWSSIKALKLAPYAYTKERTVEL